MTEYEKGYKRGYAGKTSTSLADDLTPFRTEKNQRDREEGARDGRKDRARDNRKNS